MTDMVRFGPSKYDIAVVYENLAVSRLENAQGRWGSLKIYYPAITLWSDHPIALLDAEWVTAAQKVAARRLIAFLRSRPQQQRALAFGFRPADPAVPIRTADAEPVHPPRVVRPAHRRPTGGDAAGRAGHPQPDDDVDPPGAALTNRLSPPLPSPCGQGEGKHAVGTRDAIRLIEARKRAADLASCSPSPRPRGEGRGEGSLAAVTGGRSANRSPACRLADG